MEFGGIVLSGGKSSRMGTDKGSLQVDGKYLAKYSIDLLAECGIQDVLLITNEPEKYAEIPCKKFVDEIANVGPIGGIYTGLINSSHLFNVVLACDTPKISKEIITILADNYSPPITTVSYQGRIQPLISIFSVDVIDLMKKQIENSEFKILDFIQSLNGTVLELDEFLQETETDYFININTPEDLIDLSLQKRNERL
ncbi:molybdenum cofactor guanylyltransferase [bacterium]|nr:MAG: molybdenum cofactor guanylyltransferase [bacterium]TNF32341.1 MAG: molybdenum cofactor guanylyltransferase [Deltaproteobacteria bacterium]